MSLRPQADYVVPAETKRVAEAIFPKGNLCLTLAKELSGFINDQDFDSLFSTQGQPAASPWWLALATVLQYVEGLSDRQTADAVRSRIDWKYRLCLDLTNEGFHHTVLSEFRSRLVSEHAAALVFEQLLQRCQELFAPWREQWPEPVWFGHTLANQHEANVTLDAIAQIPAPMRFISHEPFLGPIDYADYGDVLDLVILDGESGGKARMCDLDAMAATITSCRAAEIKVFVKQLGAKPMYHQQPLTLKSRKGGDMKECPAVFEVREMPASTPMLKEQSGGRA